MTKKKTTKKAKVEKNAKAKPKKKKIDFGKLIGKVTKKEPEKEKALPSKPEPQTLNEKTGELDFSKITEKIQKEISKEKTPEEGGAQPKREEIASGSFDPAAVEKAVAVAEKSEETKKQASGVDKVVKDLKKVVEKFSIERVQTGIFGLDELIEGGFEQGSAVLVVGSAGTGKSLFGLQFLHYGATEENEPGIYISFEEDRDSLLRHSGAFGWDFERLEKEKKFKILSYKPHQVEKLMQEGGGPIRDAIRQMGAKRLVIDSITSYGLLFKDEYQRRETILEFFELLHKWGCTSVIISELPPKVAEVKEGSVGFLTDAIISLYYSKEEDKGVRVHSCEILKMRGTKHTNKLLAMGFEKHGIVVYPEVEVF